MHGIRERSKIQLTIGEGKSDVAVPGSERCVSAAEWRLLVLGARWALEETEFELDEGDDPVPLEGHYFSRLRLRQKLAVLLDTLKAMRCPEIPSPKEVRQIDYRTVIGGNPSYCSEGGDGKAEVMTEETSHYPVESVSWNYAAEFCPQAQPSGSDRAVSGRTGAGRGPELTPDIDCRPRRCGNMHVGPGRTVGTAPEIPATTLSLRAGC
jgi:hypothetical protein